MTQESWIAEFYPTPAWKVDKPDALAHSLRKWKGLTKEAYARHFGVAPKNPPIPVDNSTCALCKHHCVFNCDTLATECPSCPLAQSRYGTPCDSRMPHEHTSPWSEWKSRQNPAPMIEALEKAVRFSEA